MLENKFCMKRVNQLSKFVACLFSCISFTHFIFRVYILYLSYMYVVYLKVEDPPMVAIGNEYNNIIAFI